MATRSLVIVGSRSSPLSIAQTAEVVSILQESCPKTEFRTVYMTTVGDRQKDIPLDSFERGVFAKEIEIALLDGRIDIAVHSAKDLTSELPEGLVVGAIPTRSDPRDVLVNRWGVCLEELPKDATLGTSSPRRVAQIGALRPDIKVVPIRGNVGTRLDKVKFGIYDGVVLAAAGLLRIGRQKEVSEFFPIDIFTPDVGQGALAVQTRNDEVQILKMLEAVNDSATSFEVGLERSFLSQFGSGCNVPVSAYAKIDSDGVGVSAMAATPDGTHIYRISLRVEENNFVDAGRVVASKLLQSGADKIVYGN